MSIAPNPSHLEAVNPVAEGLTRPKQDRLGDTKRERVIPLLIHGDAAMAGQGVVAETMNLSQSPRLYDRRHDSSGGQQPDRIHHESGRGPIVDVLHRCRADGFGLRSSTSTATIPEACIRATQIAYDYRQRFHKDVVIDMVCYRKYGHNEADDPSYTQPILYRKIRAQKPVADAVCRAAGTGRPGDGRGGRRHGARSQKKRLYGIYDQAQKRKEQYELQELSAIPAAAIPMDQSAEAVGREVLERIVDRITTFPADFHLHPKLTAFVRKRRESFQRRPAAYRLGAGRSAGVRHAWCWTARRCV